MDELLVFTPQHQLDYQKNYDDFIAFTKNELTLFSDAELVTKDGIQKGWECEKWSWASERGRTLTIVFGKSQSRSKYTPFKYPFSDFAKAYVRYEQSLNPKNATTWASSLAFIYSGLEEKAKLNGRTTISIMDLDNQVINEVEDKIRASNLSAGAKRNVGLSLQKVLDFIVDKRFKLNLQEWKNPFARPIDTRIKTDDSSRKIEEDKCPSDFQMLQVAEAFRRAKTPKQKYFASLCVAMMLQPSRAVELSGLTVHSLQKSEKGRWFLAWYPAKGGDPVTKWIPKLLEDVAQQAITNLIEISKPARNAAKFAFENPNMFMIHEKCSTPAGFSQSNGLTYTQFADALGFRSGVDSNGRNITWNNVTNLKWLNNLFNRLNNTSNWRKERLSGLTLKANNEVFKKNGKEPIEVDLKFPSYADLRTVVDDEYMTEDFPKYGDFPIWDCITLIRDNEFHKEFSVKPFSWVFTGHGTVSDAIGSERIEGSQSIFDELEIYDEDGSLLMLNTHQFRHWLNTKLKLAGEADWLIAKWSGRANIEQNKAYDGRTPEQRSRLTKRIGAVSNTSNVLTVAEADKLLAEYSADNPPSALILHDLKLPIPLSFFDVNRRGAAIFTGLGYCLHNHAESPCIKNIDCAVCTDHSCLKGLPNSLNELMNLELLDEGALEKAKEKAGNLVFGADRWVTYYGLRLAKIKTLIRGLQDPKRPDGSAIRVPKGLDPSPVKRSLGITELDGLKEIIGRKDAVKQTLVPALEPVQPLDLLALAESDLKEF